MAIGAVCAETLRQLHGLQLHLRVGVDADVERGLKGWIDAADLETPDGEPFAPLLTRFGAVGAAVNRRVAAAAFLLRFGWAGGFAIASYLACDRVPLLDGYALQFSPQGLLHGLAIRSATFSGFARDPLAGGRDWTESIADPPSTDERDALRRRLLESLLALSEPVVAVQHHWSRFSRHALWSMVVSSWAAQFTSIGRQLGDPARGIREALATFALAPEIARAAPELYEIHSGDCACTCQRRAACCLYFKQPGRPFCASCPVIPEAERLGRNRQWVRAQRPLVCA